MTVYSFESFDSSEMKGYGRVLQALAGGTGFYFTESELFGEITTAYEVSRGSSRKVLRRNHAEDCLSAFSAWCALQVSHLWPMPAIVAGYIKNGHKHIRAEAIAACGNPKSYRTAEDLAKHAAIECIDPCKERPYETCSLAANAIFENAIKSKDLFGAWNARMNFMLDADLKLRDLLNM